MVLCAKLLERLGLPAKGRRNLLGALYGIRGDAWLNGVHPGQLSAHQSNGDTQLPYRLPICDATHADAECAANCAEAGVDKA